MSFLYLGSLEIHGETECGFNYFCLFVAAPSMKEHTQNLPKIEFFELNFSNTFAQAQAGGETKE